MCLQMNTVRNGTYVSRKRTCLQTIRTHTRAHAYSYTNTRKTIHVSTHVQSHCLVPLGFLRRDLQMIFKNLASSDSSPLLPLLGRLLFFASGCLNISTVSSPGLTIPMSKSLVLVAKPIAEEPKSSNLRPVSSRTEYQHRNYASLHLW